MFALNSECVNTQPMTFSVQKPLDTSFDPGRIGPMVKWDGLDYANELARPTSDPMYLRIVGFLRRKITEGHLSEGSLLPTEREFARMAGISRGTVSLAYDELKRDGIITATRGRGSRIATDRYVSNASRKEQAIRVLSNALERLEALGFSAREVKAFMHFLLMERDGLEVKVRCALVDCNPEALGLLAQQLESAISNLDLVPILLEDLPKFGPTELGTFDLVLTTESHTPQVMGHLSNHAFPTERLLSVAVSPSRETLVALARMPENAQVTVHVGSRRFAEIIQKHLTELGHTSVTVSISDKAFVPAPEDSTRFILPAGSASQAQPDENNVILFDYQVDRGSLLRVEEAVTSLLLSKSESFLDGR
jgi:DNA-binding transcriptional regulator YhcF (GntR family)